MSKRHQSNRRRTYGRRQHELHERQADRRQHSTDDELELDRLRASASSDPLAFLDTAQLGPRLRYAMGD